MEIKDKKGKKNIAPSFEPKQKAKKVNPKSLANLRPAWKKGESGNPQGSSKLMRISHYIREELNKAGAVKTIKGENGEIKTIEVNKLELIVRKLADRASKGHIASTEILFDRLEGKPKSGMLNVDDDSDGEDTLTEIKISIAKKDKKGKISFEDM